MDELWQGIGAVSSIKEFYKQKVEEFGPERPEALSYNSRETQEARFEVLSTLIIDSTSCSILDVGCGVGDLSWYLKQKIGAQFAYTGLDIVPEMILAAEQKYPDAKFICADFLAADIGQYDYVLSSGAMTVFFSTRDQQLEYVKKFIAKMYACSKLGCAFNLLDERAESMYLFDERYFYANPLEILDFCRSICANAEFVEGYLPNDFTLKMFHY